MAKPSMSICVPIIASAQPPAGSSWPRPQAGAAVPAWRGTAAPPRPDSLTRCGLLRQVHEGGKGHLAVGLVGRPDRHLLAVLPLDIDAGDEPRPVFQRVRELIVLAVELDAPDRPDVIGLLQRRDHLVGVGRVGALD